MSQVIVYLFRNLLSVVCLSLFIYFMTTSEGVAEQVYPSAKVALVIPGGHVAPEHSETLKVLPDAEAVRRWEQQYTDLVVGGDIGENLQTSAPPTLGYMYNQKLDFNPTLLEMYVRQRAETMGDSYESLFLHFAEDTWLNVKRPHHGSLTPFGGFPYAVGWTVNPGHAGYQIYQRPPYDKPVWKHHQKGGGLYVYLFEKFDRLNLSLSASAGGGQLVVEYPSDVDANGYVTAWSELSVTDGTDNLSKSGEIRWQPPISWKRAITHDGSGRSYGGGPFMAKTLIRDGGRFYVVRLMWRNGSGQVPRLADVRLKDWMPVVSGSQQNHSVIGAVDNATTSTVRLIPGWDPDNDKNGDGYVDDSEFNNLVNPYARARFEYEARVVPLGRMWSSRSSYCRPNLFHPRIGQYLAEFYRESWFSKGLLGAYNDDHYKLLGKVFTVVSGGRLREFDGLVSEEKTENAYRSQFARVLTQIDQDTGYFVGANISMLNPYEKKTSAREFLPAFSVLLREGYIRPSLGLSGWFGLNRAWDTFALAAQDRWSVLMAMVNHGSRVHRLGSAEDHWQKDIESNLAQYYLLNVPGKTFFHSWNQSFSYGSGNTSRVTFHAAGIPKNVAYRPEGMLRIDIGAPDPLFPSGFEPMSYMSKTDTGDYTLIGDSSQSSLLDAHPEADGRRIEVIPSNIYYLQRSDDEVVPGGPAEAVLARNYTNGLVLYRTNFLGHNAEFQNTLSVNIILPGIYRRILYDGSLSDPLSSIRISGYEGVILQKVD